MIEADKKETIIEGYAFLEDESEEERAALQRRLIWYRSFALFSKDKDVKMRKSRQDLGIYLADDLENC